MDKVLGARSDVLFLIYQYRRGEAAFENLDTRIPSPRKSGQLVDALSRLLGALDEVCRPGSGLPEKCWAM